MSGIYRGRNTKEFYLASALYDSIEDLNSRAVISLLKEKNADANIVLPDKGISPFHLAIGSENADFSLQIAALILQHGGDPNVRSDEGLTPLHIAAAWGREEIVLLLLNSGADPELKDYSYQTAADYAQEEGHLDIHKTIKDRINTDIRAFFDAREEKHEILLILDKVLVNNGQAVGEYELIKSEAETGTIDLKVLPHTTPDEYVLNWCNTLETQLENGNANYSTADDAALKSSPSYDFTGSVSFGNGIQFPPKFKKPSESPTGRVIYEEHPLKDFERFIAKRESGIVTLPDSVIGDSTGESLDEVDKSHKEKSSIGKAKDTSSDYFTCTDVSENANPLDQNIFEVSSTASSNRGCDLNEALLLSTAESELSFVSVSEVYKYVDQGEGVVLYEKRLLPLQARNANETDAMTVSSTKSSVLSSLPRSFDYDTDTLRIELTRIGFEPGPITKTTKKVYLRKLYNLKRNPLEIPIKYSTNKKVFSVEIQKTLRNPSWSSDLTSYRTLEEAVSRQFSSPDPCRKWREGVNKSSFTYLLLDPRITQNFPCRVDLLTEQEQWEMFLSAVFYVGKGKRSRPYQHLYEAVSLYNEGVYKSGSKKLQRIMDIWGESQGVICLHVFQNVIPVEAYTREAAMISALKIENLENIKVGDFYGVAATWNSQQKRNLGAYLLFKAMKIFLQEGERQLSPNDID